MLNADQLAVWLQARRERAFRLLSSREHSQAELSRKLNQLTRREAAKPDLAPDATTRSQLIEELVAELVERDYQSDERFIRSLRDKILCQGKGVIAFKFACREHQLASSLVNAELMNLEEIWPEQISRVIAKKFGNQLPTDQKSRAKAYRFLASRGFTSDLIQKHI